MLNSLVFLQQVNAKKSEKLAKAAEVEEKISISSKQLEEFQ